LGRSPQFRSSCSGIDPTRRCTFELSPAPAALEDLLDPHLAGPTQRLVGSMPLQLLAILAVSIELWNRRRADWARAKQILESGQSSASLQ